MLTTHRQAMIAAEQRISTFAPHWTDVWRNAFLDDHATLISTIHMSCFICNLHIEFATGTLSNHKRLWTRWNLTGQLRQCCPLNIAITIILITEFILVSTGPAMLSLKKQLSFWRLAQALWNLHESSEFDRTCFNGDRIFQSSLSKLWNTRVACTVHPFC